MGAYWLTHIYEYHRDTKIFDAREDVWFDFDSESVVLERQPKNGLFLGSLGEFSTDPNKNVAVIDEKIETFDRPEIFDELTTPAQWDWVEKTIRFCEENPEKDLCAYTDGKNIEFSFCNFRAYYPYCLRSSSRAVGKTVNRSDKEMFLWLTFEVAWEVSCRAQRLTPSVMALFKKYKAPDAGGYWFIRIVL